MINISATEYDIFPEQQVGLQLSAMFKVFAKMEGEKHVTFQKGTYYINRTDCDYVYYPITNTANSSEYDHADDVAMHHVAFHLVGIHDLTIDAQGATFLIDGKVTNCVICDCKNVTIQNLKLDTVSPNMHKLIVTKQSPFSVEFELSRSSVYQVKNGNYTWTGNGYQLDFLQFKNRAFWTAAIKPSKPQKLFRTCHPFMGTYKIKEVRPYHFRVYYLAHQKFEVGQTLYVFNAKRDDAGIFVSKSQNITLDSVAQYFNYSLAYVAQDCTDLTLRKLHFAPKDGSEIAVASLADFIQICMCSGDVVIEDCYFNASADDALNVHGVHFKISKAEGNCIDVQFCHPQTWGFNPLHVGDAIDFIDIDSLLSLGQNRITASELISSDTISLTLENGNLPVGVGGIIEDIDRCPNVYFKNNELHRVITRGLLLSTRGKIVVENNHFFSTTMSSILISDDAKSWYESGMVKDVVIKNNRFDYCEATTILVKPENSSHQGAVHQNIHICGNRFANCKGEVIKLKSVSDVIIEKNKFCTNATKLNQKNAERVTTKF